MQTDDKGETLWEMFLRRIHQGGNNGSGLAFYNPRDGRVGSPLTIAYSNGPEFADHDFTLREIREYNRRIGGQDYRFVDYVLRGVNNKSFDAADAIEARVRAVPNPAGAHDALLLRLVNEFAFAEDFLGVVKDDSGVFEVTDEASGATDTFRRINDLKELPRRRARSGGNHARGESGVRQGLTRADRYWDYWRDADLGGGASAKEFVFVEMNRETGWFQIWRGREFFT